MSNTSVPLLVGYPLTEQHLPRVLNVLLNLHKEGDGLPAIEKTVVVGKGEVHHLFTISTYTTSRWQ